MNMTKTKYTPCPKLKMKKLIYFLGLGSQAQPSATCILNIALPTRDGCDKF